MENVMKKEIIAKQETEEYDPYKGMKTKDIVQDLVKRLYVIENCMLDYIEVAKRVDSCEQEIENIDYLLEQLNNGMALQNNSFSYDKKREQHRLDLYKKDISSYLDSMPINKTIINNVKKSLDEAINWLREGIDLYPEVPFVDPNQGKKKPIKTSMITSTLP
jgi:hypothetical protein